MAPCVMWLPTKLEVGPVFARSYPEERHSGRAGGAAVLITWFQRELGAVWTLHQSVIAALRRSCLRAAAS